MSSISGISSSMHIAAGSLATHSVGMQVSAHNVANISTDGFLPQRATYATGSGGIGVELETVRKLEQPGDAALEGANLGASTSVQVGTQFAKTELAREMPHMILTERGFQANAATIRTSDEMLGTLLDSIA